MMTLPLHEIDQKTLKNVRDVYGSSHILKTFRLDDKNFYLKFSDEELFEKGVNPNLQILVEYLSYRIYSLYHGVSVPETIHLVYDEKENRVGLATSEVKGKFGHTISAKKLAGLMSAGVFVDIFLANWDVVGYGGNIIIDKETAYRIDPGGALTFRARGQRKGKAFNVSVSELDRMLDPHGEGSAEVLSLSDAKIAAKSFVTVPWSTIQKTIVQTEQDISTELQKFGMKSLLKDWKSEAQHILRILKTRHTVIMAHVKKVLKENALKKTKKRIYEDKTASSMYTVHLLLSKDDFDNAAVAIRRSVHSTKNIVHIEKKKMPQDSIALHFFFTIRPEATKFARLLRFELDSIGISNTNQLISIKPSFSHEFMEPIFPKTHGTPEEIAQMKKDKMLESLIRKAIKEELDSLFDDKPAYLSVLDIASSGTEGVPWTITKDWAMAIVSDLSLKLKQNPGDMSGEKSALFDWEGTTLRLKLSFPNRWVIYKGSWKSDPRWTGD